MSFRPPIDFPPPRGESVGGHPELRVGTRDTILDHLTIVKLRAYPPYTGCPAVVA